MAWMDSFDMQRRDEEASRHQRVIIVSSQHPQEAAQTTSVSSADARDNSTVIINPSQVEVVQSREESSKEREDNFSM